MPRLTEQEQQEIIRFIEADRPLPEKYRFLLFEDKREVELVWNGKSAEVCNIVLPFQVIEQVDEPRAEKPEDSKRKDKDQWLLFTFNQPVTLERIEVANGYQRDQQRFYGNARVRTMRIDYSSGQSQEIQLFDDMGYQQVVPALESGQTVTSVKMTILSVYSGDEWEDLGLSEVRFVGSR